MRTWSSLQQLSREELIAEFDREAKTVGVWGTAFIRDEIFQRDREAQGARMEQMTAEMAAVTRELRSLTRWIAGLPVVNTAGVIAALWRGEIRQPARLTPFRTGTMTISRQLVGGGWSVRLTGEAEELQALAKRRGVVVPGNGGEAVSR